MAQEKSSSYWIEVSVLLVMTPQTANLMFPGSQESPSIKCRDWRGSFLRFLPALPVTWSAHEHSWPRKEIIYQQLRDGRTSLLKVLDPGALTPRSALHPLLCSEQASLIWRTQESPETFSHPSPCSENKPKPVSFCTSHLSSLPQPFWVEDNWDVEFLATLASLQSV